MKSALKNSPTHKEKLRAAGVNATVELTNSGMERLNDLISKMADVCDGLIEGMDRTPSSETVNQVYKIGQTIAGLTRARTDLEKLRLETKGLHQKAFSSIQEQIRVQLQGRPELVAELIEVSNTVNEQILTSKQ
ncbi:MAG: hypothetical protein M0T73_10960 [Deltaproteobacteria bacterium]|nr:hypothetical protein [Deltaproteobacteria bacterium]